MMLRSYIFLLVGVALVGVGLVVFGVRYLDSIALPTLALAGATAALAIGIPCLAFARAEARQHSKWRLTSTGVVVVSVFIILLFADLVFSVIRFPNPQRGEVFYSLAAALIISMGLAEKVLTRMGKPIAEYYSK